MCPFNTLVSQHVCLVFYFFQNMDDSFELKNHTSDPSLKYFMEHPIRKWSYTHFKGAVNKSKKRTQSSTKTKNEYLSAMNNIQNLSM